MTEHLSKFSEDRLHILADPIDYQSMIRKVGAPWSEFCYHFFGNETSTQQARWILTERPLAENYWPEVEVVYCTNPSYVPTRKARLVVTLHDAATFESGALPADWRLLKQRLKSKYLYKILSRKVDLIHTVSHFSAERLAHFFPGLKSRLCVVPNAVPPRFFEPASPEGDVFVQKCGLNARPFILLPGGLNHRKNAELVLQAWPVIHARHPDLVLVVAGSCESAFARRAQVFTDSAILTGFVSDEALCSLYHEAQLVWFPSLYEGFGIPILEAMASGTPVVASSSTSIPEVAGGAAALASPSCAGDHVETIDSLLMDSRRRQDLAERGKSWAQQFTWPRTASKLRHHLLSLV